MTSSTLLSLFRKGGSSEVSRKAEKSALFYESSFETFSSKGKKGLKNTALKVHTPSRESDTERERERRRRRRRTRDARPRIDDDGNTYNNGHRRWRRRRRRRRRRRLPVAPLPDGLKDAPEETQQRYFKEAKRVAIEKCRTHRCGNDEVTAKTHLGPEIFITEEDAALLGRTEWKRPSLTACTAQEFAYDFFTTKTEGSSIT